MNLSFLSSGEVLIARWRGMRAKRTRRPYAPTDVFAKIDLVDFSNTTNIGAPGCLYERAPAYACNKAYTSSLLVGLHI